jgi:hypothetical protein
MFVFMADLGSAPAYACGGHSAAHLLANPRRIWIVQNAAESKSIRLSPVIILPGLMVRLREFIFMLK